MRGVGPTPVRAGERKFRLGTQPVLVAAQVIRIRNHVARVGRVVLVDEFRSTCVCHRCHANTVRSTRDYATLHCPVERQSVNRDVNSSHNLASIFQMKMLGLERPTALRPQQPAPAWLTRHLATPAWVVLNSL